MQQIKKHLIVISILLNASVSYTQVTDSVTYIVDTAAAANENFTTEFFLQGEKSTEPGKILLVTKARKTVSLVNFAKSISAAGFEGDHSSFDYVFADLDNDGKNELVVSGFTGGAHCCDEIYIFKNIAPGKYQHVVKMFAGHTAITKAKEFEFSFDEALGYFFTCYACGYSDTSDAAPVPLRNITLRYSKGKISVVPGDQELRSLINDNLGKLGEQPFAELDKDALAMDEGLRKEFAMNLAVFYYSFGRNMAATQKLFNQYYKYPDAKKVWAAFTKNLLAIKKDNDF